MCVTIAAMLGGVFLLVDEEVLTYSAFFEERQVPWFVWVHVTALKVFVQRRHVVSTSSSASDMGQATVRLGMENRARTFARPRATITH